MKIKSFAKRSVSIMLTILLVVSMFAVVATTVSAAEVDVATTGYNLTMANGTYLYFDNSVANWSYSYVYFCIGHDSYSEIFQMSKIANTNMYYYQYNGSDWNGANYVAVFGNSSSWGGGSWGSSNLNNAASYFIYNHSDWGLSSTVIMTPEASSKGSKLGLEWKAVNYSANFNYTQTVNVQTTTNNGSSGTNSSTPAKVTISGYAFNGNNSTGSGSNSTTKGSTYSTTYGAAKTSQVTLSYSELASGYSFVGWYNSSGTRVSTATSYKYTVTGAATYYARFALSTTYTVAARVYTNGALSSAGGTATVSSSSVVSGTSVTFTATANTGYDFNGWFSSSTATTPLSTNTRYSKTITANTTLYAKFTSQIVVTPPASVSIELDEDTNTITAVASGGTVDEAPPESYTYVLYKDKKAVDTNTTGIFTYESSEEDASYYVKAYPETYEGYATSSETVTVEGVAQFTTPIVSASSTYVAPGESYTITAYVPGITGATYTLYDFSDNMITANTKGTFAMTAQNSIGDYSYYVVATLGELSSRSDNITIHVVSETQTSLTVKVLFKSTDTYGYETYATVGSAKTQMTKAAANAALNIPENLGTNSSQTATYYWYETTATVTKGEKVTIVFTSNRYNLNASITVTFNYSGTYFFAADDLNNSLTAVDLTNVTPAQRNWVQSANHMVYNPEKDGALPSTGADIEIAVSGDVDYDSKLTIKDVTLIQRRLAQIVAFNDAQEASADYNGDGIVSILDASVIQRELVNR